MDLPGTITASEEQRDKDLDVVDWSLLPAACRYMVVQLLDRASRAAWRLAHKQARQDVWDAARGIEWIARHQRKQHLTTATRDRGTDTSLMSLGVSKGHVGLRSLGCSGMTQLRSLQGLPLGLHALDLRGCVSLQDWSPLRHCSMLKQLVLGSVDGSMRFPSELSAIPTLEDLTINALAWLRTQDMLDTLHALTALTHLRRLTLTADASLPYSGQEALASVLAALTALQHLSLGVQMWDSLEISLVETISTLTHLTSLHVPSSGLAAALVPCLPALSNLASLDIQDNRLGNASAIALYPALNHLPFLTELRMGQNPSCYEDLAASDLFPGLQSALSTLQLLDLTNVGLTHEAGAQALAPFLRSLPNLTWLSLASNKLRLQGLLALKLDTSLCVPRLQTLDLTSAKLEGAQGGAALASVLTAHPALTELHLQHNDLGSAGAESLAAALPSLSQLRVLSLARCWLGPQGMAFIAPALAALPALSRVDVRRNYLQSEGARVLAAVVGGMHALEWLGAKADNGFSAANCEQLQGAVRVGVQLE